MRVWTARAAVLLYAAILCLAVPTLAWPEWRSPVLWRASDAAARLLRAGTLVSGMHLFTGASPELKPVARCIRVTGRLPTGEVLVLHERECPTKGFSFGTDIMSLVMRRIGHNFHVPTLLDFPDPVRRRYNTTTRSFLALGDFFCHSPLVHSVPRSDVVWLRETKARRYSDGAEVSTGRMRCEWRCQVGRVASPRCHWFPPAGPTPS